MPQRCRYAYVEDNASGKCSTAMRANASKQGARQPYPPGAEQVARGVSSFQRREWIFQRVGWVFLGLVVLAGLAGLFGNGPLSNRSLSNESATLKFERFVRRDADTRWELELHRLASSGTVDVTIDAPLGASFETVSIQPTPTSTSLSKGRWVYHFELRGEGENRVVFIVQPEHMGQHNGTITVSNAPAFSISQFAYP
jgi:hypothetical protein